MVQGGRADAFTAADSTFLRPYHCRLPSFAWVGGEHGMARDAPRRRRRSDSARLARCGQ